jgi:hypothetical protein
MAACLLAIIYFSYKKQPGAGRVGKRRAARLRDSPLRQKDVIKKGAHVCPLVPTEVGNENRKSEWKPALRITRAYLRIWEVLFRLGTSGVTESYKWSGREDSPSALGASRASAAGRSPRPPTCVGSRPTPTFESSRKVPNACAFDLYSPPISIAVGFNQ